MTAKIQRIDKERRSIVLNLKDPWINAAERYAVNSACTGKVIEVRDTFALVELEPDLAGLLPISEVANYFVKDIRAVLSPGQVVRARIIEIDARNRKMRLSIKRL